MTAAISKQGMALSATFMDALTTGVLNPLLKHAQADETLLLALRGSYINIYYRGENLINIAEKDGGAFSASFDLNYFRNSGDSLRKELEALPKIKLDSDGVSEWIKAIPQLRLAIDVSFGSGKDMHEREFQQLVARENNSSALSNETEYFVADIECTSAGLGARFDLLAVQWLANQRRDGSNCRLALVEMKYGDNALGGESDLSEHLKDLEQFLSRPDAKESLLQELEQVFKQMGELGLIRFGKSGNIKHVQLDREAKPEIIFRWTIHNLRSTKLMAHLDEIQIPEEIDLCFFVESFAGDGMQSHKLSLDKFKEFLHLFGMYNCDNLTLDKYKEMLHFFQENNLVCANG